MGRGLANGKIWTIDELLLMCSNWRPFGRRVEMRLSVKGALTWRSFLEQCIGSVNARVDSVALYLSVSRYDIVVKQSPIR